MRSFFTLGLLFIIICSSCSDDPVIEPTLTVSDFSATLIERPAAGSSLGFVKPNTPTEDLVFSIISQTEADALRMDPNTGEILVNDELQFDINSTELLEAEVEVSSGSESVIAEIDINLSLPEETISYFKDIALGFEFGGASEITRKWRDNMKIFIGGTPTPGLTTELNAIIDDINALTPETFKVEIVDDTLASNYYVYFGSGDSFAGIFPSQASFVESNWGLFTVFWNGASELIRGHMYVDIFRASELEQRHLLREELTQSLGLAKDSPRYQDSIFQQSFSTRTTQYAEIDKDLIYLLYHPDMQTGLSGALVDSKLREIIKSEW